jgi:hypothetical protein
VRSHRRNVLERIIGILFLPYRCVERDHRFFKLRWLPAETEKQMAAPAQVESLPVIVRRAS